MNIIPIIFSIILSSTGTNPIIATIELENATLQPQAQITFGGLKVETPYRIHYDGVVSSLVHFTNQSGQFSINKPSRFKENTGMHLIYFYEWKYIEPKPGEPMFQDVKD